MKTTPAKFIKQFVKQFPVYENIIMDEDWLNLPNLQLGAISRIFNKLIEEEKFTIIDEITAFFEQIYSSANDELRNAIAVAFLEHLKLDSNIGKQVLDRFPPTLKSEYTSIMDYNKSLLEDEDLKKFLDDLQK